MTNLEAVLICVAIWFYVFGGVECFFIAIHEDQNNLLNKLLNSLIWFVIVPVGIVTSWKEE